jgi:hypothetical protein
MLIERAYEAIGVGRSGFADVSERHDDSFVESIEAKFDR